MNKHVLLSTLFAASTGCCFAGVIDDGGTGRGLDDVRIVSTNCADCPSETTTTATTDGMSGLYVFDPYSGGPYIYQSMGEAVRIDASRAGYVPRTVFHHVVHQDNPRADGQRFDARGFPLYRVGTRDTDRDGLFDEEERQLGTDPFDADSDGDALPDGWEVLGHNWIDLAAHGADPLRKDIFVECDVMAGIAFVPGALEDVIESFANAPVSNPDGSTGITLHIDVDETVAHDANLQPIWVEFDAIREHHFSPHRERIYHYCILGDRYGGGTSSGRSRGIGAVDFVVTLGPTGGNAATQSGTFMHELGHNLGLEHGGRDSVNHKPNYLSVMNYSFQFSGLLRDGEVQVWDYSRFSLDPLDETALSESRGLDAPTDEQAEMRLYRTRHYPRTGPLRWAHSAWRNVDWDGDGVIDSARVEVDINGDGECTELRSSNDWARIDYGSGGRIGPARAGVAPPSAPREVDCQDAPF